MEWTVAMNEQVRKARETALDILKPTKKELEHGLKLHAESIVCESYGFAPCCRIDSNAIKALIEQGGSAMEVQDLTERMTTTRCVTDPAERQEYLAAWRQSGLTFIFQNAGVECQSPKYIIKRLANFTYVTDMLSPDVRKAVKAEDIVRAKEQDQHCLGFSCNGVPLVEDWVSVEDELRYIKVFYNLGCRMMHLTYNRRNMIGDGCMEPDNAGLSDFGRAVVAEMNRVGVLIDVAHSGHKTSLEAACASNMPVVASHSSCFALSNHLRGKPDKVIKAIADTGGYIGICCIPRFIGLGGDINAFLDHIDYVVKKFGADYVTIGTDHAYRPARAENENKAIPHRPARPRWENHWSNDPTISDPQWQKPEQKASMAWTNWPLFTVGMVKRGYSDKDIKKILGGNVLRVLKAITKQ